MPAASMSATIAATAIVFILSQRSAAIYSFRSLRGELLRCSLGSLGLEVTIDSILHLRFAEMWRDRDSQKGAKRRSGRRQVATHRTEFIPPISRMNRMTEVGSRA